MILLYIYCDAPCSFKMSWGAQSTVQEQLSTTFQNLLLSDSNLLSQQLFDDSCDSFHNLLTSYDPVVFPHFGACMMSASAILEYVCLVPDLCLLMAGQFQQRLEVLLFCLPMYCGPLDWLDNTNALLSLQVWFNLWFAHQNWKESK
jgi:hypothetical protein